MTPIPQALVEKAAQIIEDPDAPYFVSAGAGKRIARAVLAAVLPDLPAARLVMERDALARVITQANLPYSDPLDIDALSVAEIILASGAMQDAADVRRAVAEEIAAKLGVAPQPRDKFDCGVWAENRRAARIARKVGER